MVDNQSDENLLGAFVKSGDELAFRKLAERYSGLIFHTAMRTLNERALAEDVSQRVLVVLAKKAARVATGNAPLPAWLHRTTLLEARSARRSESRHHRKKEALMNAPTDHSRREDSAWKEALPYLDAAIDKLPDADRYVLLLHFANEMTFPQIAREVGKSAAAVQKQSRRALESLRRVLGRRGVSLSIGLLTAGLTAEMSKAAPVIALPALSSIPSLKTTASTLVVKKSTTLAIGATLLLCSVPLARQQSSIRELESALRNPTDSTLPLQASTGRTSSRRLSLPEQLARDLGAKETDVPRYRGAVDYLEGLDDEVLISLIKETAESSLNTKALRLVIGSALDAIADRDLETGRLRDPEAALNALMDHLPVETIATIEQGGSRITYYLRSFSENDGAGALAWFHTHFAQIQAVAGLRRGSAEQFENRIRMNLSYGLIFSAPADAIKILQPLPRQEIIWEFDQFVRSVEPSLRKDASGFIRVTRGLLPENDAIDVISGLTLVSYDYKLDYLRNVDILLGKYEFSPSESEAILKRAGVRSLESGSRSAGGLEKAIPEYMEWLATHSHDEMDARVGEALGTAVLSWSQSKEPIYKAMLNYQALGLNENALIALLNTAASKFEMEKVETLVGLLSDEEAAARIIEQVKPPETR